VVGNAAHGKPVAACKRKVQKRGYLYGILGKHFIKITQPEKEHVSLMFPFYSPVLIQHGAGTVLEHCL
jgi:hypothetical protein